MAELKTKKNNSSVAAFLARVKDPERRKDCKTMARMMREATGEKPKMWGSSIVGFGTSHYQYASGREVEWLQIGFSPRKQDLTLYLMCGLDRRPSLMKKLGKHKTGVSCLYIKRLADVDLAVLERLIRLSVEEVRKKTVRRS